MKGGRHTEQGHIHSDTKAKFRLNYKTQKIQAAPNKPQPEICSIREPAGDYNDNLMKKIFPLRSRSRSPGGPKKGIGKFGSPLHSLPLEPSPIEPGQQTPTLLNTLILCLRPHLSTEGIFRACAPKNTVNILKAKAEANRLLEEPLRDPLALACLLKTWLRELPNGIVPMATQENLLKSSSLEEVEVIISKMAPVNRSTLFFLFKFLNDVAKNADNHMSASALAICIGPSLFRVGSSDAEALKITNKTNEIASKCIKNYATLFRLNSTEKETVKMNSISSPRHMKKQSVISQLTPPTTPSRTPSPKLKISATASSIENLVKTRLEEIFDQPDEPAADTPVGGSPTGKLEHSRLNLPSRSAPLRGSKRRPSRKHREDKVMNGSIDLDKNGSVSSQEFLGDGSAFDRLKKGDNLEGWRNSPVVTRPPTADLHTSPSQSLLDGNPPTKPHKAEEDPTKKTDEQPESTKDKEIASKSPSQAEPENASELATPDVPKLDLSGLSESLPSIPAPELTPTLEKRSPKRNHRTKPVSTLNNTPTTSPEVHIPKSPEVPFITEVIKPVSNSVNKERRHANRVSRETRRTLNNSTVRCSAGESAQGRDNNISTTLQTQQSRGRTSVRNSTQRPVTAQISSPISMGSPTSDFDGLDRINRLKMAVTDLEKRMFQRRAFSIRPEDISMMTELQIREEKSELQRELLLLESQFGRPQASPERQACRAIYSRYRELKRKVHQLETRSAIDKESFLREVEIELSRIELERRDLARGIRSWETNHRSKHNRNPSTEEKHNNPDYTRYRHLKSRRYFLQELQQLMAPQSFTV